MRNWIIASGIALLAVAGALADIDGTISFLERLTGSKPEESRDEAPSLELVNLDIGTGIEHGTNRPNGANLATVQAIVKGTGDRRVWVAVGGVDGYLGDDRCEQDNVAWNALPVAKSVAFVVNACNIETSIEYGERKEGRVDIRLIYGPSLDELTQELRVKGSIAVTVGTPSRMTWIPDADSVVPSGMGSATTLIRPGQSALDAAHGYFEDR